MEILSGHLLQELLYSSPQSRIYRGARLLDGLPVIIKILNQPHPSAERRARFEQEYRLMQRLQLDAIAIAYSLENEQGQLAIVMEDLGGQSLNRLAIAGALPLDDWLRLAIRITQRLGQLHARRVMHKDINPSNIVWNRDTGQLKLIDPGIATELSHEVAEPGSPERLEGTLPCISPEQTGYMNRSVDYRTDFYSLGVTLYELLTGQLPFVADDALQLVHALEDVMQLLADTMHVQPADARELAQLCLAKIGGNPFFLNQFLLTLAERDKLRPDPASGRWQWDISSIREAGITDNVVELMVASKPRSRSTMRSGMRRWNGGWRNKPPNCGPCRSMTARDDQQQALAG